MDDTIPGRHRKKHRKPHSNNTETDPLPDEPSKQFSKRELSNNWSKYDDQDPITSTDTDTTRASNFEELLSAPASIGGHFLFNSEKSWEASDDWYNRDDYFQLNLIELSNGLATIPFYERQNYAKNIFSAEEVEDMDGQARYQQFKLSTNNNKNQVNKAVGGESDKAANSVHPPQYDDDDLDELLTLTGSKRDWIQNSNAPSTPKNVGKSATIHSGETTSADSADDIQKWLDDVLILDS